MESIGNYEIMRKEIVGNAVFAVGYSAKSPEPWATWRGRGNDFQAGHYFENNESAMADFYKRISQFYETLANAKKQDMER